MRTNLSPLRDWNQPHSTRVISATYSWFIIGHHIQKLWIMKQIPLYHGFENGSFTLWKKIKKKNICKKFSWKTQK
jgi:hypothetical protein